MDRAELSRIAHEDHPIAAAVSEHRLRQLAAAAAPDRGSALDLGCGHGQWLLAVLEASEGLTGTGVDLHLPPAAEHDARRRGLADRVRWVQGDAAGFDDGDHDVVLCVGASHVFGGLDGTLTALRGHLRPGGRAVLGDGIWDAPPSPATQQAVDATPDEFPDLAGLVAAAVRHGFEVVHGHVSTLEEWDDYEWSWTGSLVRWALRQPAGSADRGRPWPPHGSTATSGWAATAASSASPPWCWPTWHSPAHTPALRPARARPRRWRRWPPRAPAPPLA